MNNNAFDYDEASDTFVKRPGTTDQGKEYEDLKIAHIAINLLGLEYVIDFKIWGNDGQYGSIDDVIAIVTKQNGDVVKIAIQLKHSIDGEKTVTKNQLTRGKGDFSLPKYFNDYQKAVTIKPHLADYIFMLQTNKKISNEEIRLGEDFVIQPEEVSDPVAFLRSNNLESKPLRFTVKTAGTSDEYFTMKETTTDNKAKKSEHQIDVKYRKEEFENFLKRLYYYPQQHNVEKTKTLCAEAFEKLFLSNEVKQFLDFVHDWSKQDGSKPKLTKALVSAKVAECLLSPFMRSYPEMKAQNAHLFLKAIHQFDVTLIDEANATRLGCIWNEDDVKEMLIDSEYDFGLNRGGLDWDQKDWQKLLWHLHGRHLIVSLTQDNSDIISKAFSLCRACEQRRKFIFVTNAPLGKRRERFMFQNFNDLKRKDASLFTAIGTRLKILLGGKEAIPLKFILGDEEVRTSLTPSHLLRMLDGPLSIGENQDIFPDYYISRFITDYNIDFDYVNQMDSDKNVALICSNVDFSHIQQKFPNISDWSNCSDNESKNLYFCDYSQAETVFKEISNINKSKNCVCFHYCEKNPAFKWLQSSKIDPKLHQFRWLIHEAATKSEHYLLNIICNDPGMGKSWFMKRLKLNYPSKIVIYIEPKNHRFFDRQITSEEYEGFLFSVAFKYKNELAEAIYRYLYSKKAVLILWDGLDEASPAKLQNILQAIDYFKTLGLPQWVASREHLREMLENQFNILSRSIEKLDEHQQTEYIKQRLRQGNEETINSCENITKLVMHHLRPNFVNELFGIPLQLFMLTELFLHQDSNITERLTSGLFSIAKLYQHFLDGKFKFHEEEKIGWNLETANDQVADLLLKHRKAIEEHFEKAAIQATFPALWMTALDGVDLCCDQFLDDIIANGDHYGIITFVVKLTTSDYGTYGINFAHHTYAEFLAARYLTKHYQNIRGVAVILTKARFNNVRFFFDVMMAEESALHLAVLYKDVARVKQLEKRPDCKDRLGRNPLTLAALQAQYYWRRYSLLLPNNHHVKARDHSVQLTSPLPKDDALAEICSHLKNAYEPDERDPFLVCLVRHDDDASHCPLTDDKQLCDHTNWIAVSNLPSLNEIAATRALFAVGAKTKWGQDASDSITCCRKCTLC